MAGKKPIEVFVYNTDGSYICKFDNMAEFRKVYYPNDIGKRPLFNNKELGIKYHYIPECEVIVYPERVGRDTTKQLLAIHNSEYCKQEDNFEDRKPVQVFNLKNELIAEFKTLRLLTKMMPHISHSVVARKLVFDENHEDRVYKAKKFTSLGLFFKYKK